ncbi:hypothetical protein OEZ86_001885 [Tetradesmus obliquus]|nr:hypothetical protein OEZ86_001885 [Tetradesmus obliquus]
MPCQLGEFCPAGTQEETPLSIATCQLDPASASSSSSSSGCRGFKACPAGSFCPNASTSQPCVAGSYCPPGSLKGQPCNITRLLAWNPFKAVRPEPAPLLEMLVSWQQPLAGNTCPANASSPLQGCPAGYYCSHEAARAPCPPGFFCPPHSREPQPCPPLASCAGPGAAAPKPSWWGVLMLLLLVVLLLGLLEYVRVAGRRNIRASSLEDEVMQLMGAVGFQLINTQEHYVLRRIAPPPAAAKPHRRIPKFSAALSRSINRTLTRVMSATRQPHRQSSSSSLGDSDEFSVNLPAGATFIVPGVSGRFVHSQLHAVMGPSGCGKTSLCKALSGRLPSNRVWGDISVLVSSSSSSRTPDATASNAEASALSGSAGPGAAAAAAAAGGGGGSGLLPASEVAHITGFVPQFDLLHESLTAAVDEVLTLMALSNVQHQVVGCASQRFVSGGQRRRAAIGVELVARPCLLWLDEPTSGLDAAVAADVVGALKQSAARGMNVIAVMHQPRCSIFNMFDSCLLLSGGGHVAYAGPQHLALPYMAFLGFFPPPGENAADFLLDVTAGVVSRPGDADFIPSELAALWKRCGDIWVSQQQQQPPEQQELLLQALTAAQPPATPIDWPWRPRDLQALRSKFSLLVDSKANAAAAAAKVQRQRRLSSSSGAVRGGLAGVGQAMGDVAGTNNDGGGDDSVLTYEGFLGFWAEAGLRDWLTKGQYEAFIQGLCEDFGMAPGVCISRAQFMQVLKRHMHTAAAMAAGISLPVATLDPDHASRSPQISQISQITNLGQSQGSPPQTSRVQPSGLGEARTLRDLGDIILLQHLQQQMEQQQQQQQQDEQQQQQQGMPAASQQDQQQQDQQIRQQQQQQQQQQGWKRNSQPGQALHRVGTPTEELHYMRKSLSPSTALDADVAIAGAKLSAGPKQLPGAVSATRQVTGASSGTSSSAAAAAALASARQLPGVREQLWVVVVRCGRKWVSSRQNLMTDLLLTALLGLALGAAQGHLASPGESLLWLLITQLAYGCMALARSTNSYGSERHLFLQQESQGGVSVTAWVLGHQLFDLLGLLLAPALMFAWLYVLTLPSVSAGTYYSSLALVGWYTSGLGYLVSLSIAPKQSLVAGLAVALLLGGVANGVAPNMWQLPLANPLAWLNYISYTRWALQALYISWLVPASPEAAPATAAFLAQLGYCGLDPRLLAALQSGSSEGGADDRARALAAILNAGDSSNSSAAEDSNVLDWAAMRSAQRADAMAAAAAAAYRNSTAAGSSSAEQSAAAAVAALTQLWQFQSRPQLLAQECGPQKWTAFAVLFGLGLVCRLLVLLLVRWKVSRKAQE